MVQPICRDRFVLSLPSTEAEAADVTVAQDLADTLNANLDRCVGMAANMIGISRRVIALRLGSQTLVCLNPVTLKMWGDPYEAEEGCLSLEGVRTVTRYPHVSFSYMDSRMRPKQRTLHDFQAEIYQHEMDHLSGKLI